MSTANEKSEASLREKIKIFAIINITPDSFSDGGEAFSPNSALAKIEAALADGADYIDIGAQSTRPGADVLTPDEEWARLEPVLSKIKKPSSPESQSDSRAISSSSNKIALEFSNENSGNDEIIEKISIDTYHLDTAKKCAALRVGFINDVSGKLQIAPLIKDTNTRYIFMHSLTVPADKNIVMKSDDVVRDIKNLAKQRIAELESQGLNKEQLIFDPGIGFGKTAQQSLELIERADEFLDLGIEILYGHSRKSFLSLFTDAPAKDRDDQTLKFSKILAGKNIHHLRVHNTKIHQNL